MLNTMDVSEVGVAVRTGGVRTAVLKAQGHVFTIDIEIRDGGRVTLVSVADRKPRTFRDPAAALRVLHELGIPNGQFDLASWQRGAPQDATLKRPDRSQALKAAHSAAAADREFRRQVEQLLAMTQQDNTRIGQVGQVAASTLQSELVALLNDVPSSKR